MGTVTTLPNIIKTKVQLFRDTQQPLKMRRPKSKRTVLNRSLRRNQFRIPLPGNIRGLLFLGQIPARTEDHPNLIREYFLRRPHAFQ